MALQWKVLNHRISDFFEKTVSEALLFMDTADAAFKNDAATELLLHECRGRLQALADVGLGYLTLDRQSRTLSGGETQRVALTSALGSSLTESMFALDEPTVGLHPSDVDRLRDVVRGLCDGGNTVLMVEHQATMLQSADRILELGPGAGERGGEIVFDGTPAALKKTSTLTAKSWKPKKKSAKNTRKRRKINKKEVIRLQGATGNNLRHIDVEVPLGVLTCVTGVSGSGKKLSLFKYDRSSNPPSLGRQAGRLAAPYKTDIPNIDHLCNSRESIPIGTHLARQSRHLHGSVGNDPKAPCFQ